MNKIPDALKIRVGDFFSYGDGKGVWEVCDLLPGGRVGLIDRVRSLQGQRYQREIRSALESGSYKRVKGDAVAVLLEIVRNIASSDCYDDPGEFPEQGESGTAPCLPCRAKKALSKFKELRQEGK